MDTDEKGEPLEEPRIYLNLVHSDQVLPPLKATKDLADPNNDRDWKVIPISFSQPQTRTSLENRQLIFYDGHVNSCVFAKLKESERQLRAIFNYVILRFQHHLKEEFVLHKKSIKLIKKKKYKDFQGTNSQTVHKHVLPKEYSEAEYKVIKKKIDEEAKK
mmetsp:Transcript_31412/g.30761  ORF Transcript_31412/g.30761 Transcript_31412/m.30761 type:complete len:160 (+) Transcript_31412:349-828(+)